MARRRIRYAADLTGAWGLIAAARQAAAKPDGWAGPLDDATDKVTAEPLPPRRHGAREVAQLAIVGGVFVKADAARRRELARMLKDWADKCARIVGEPPADLPQPTAPAPDAGRADIWG